MNDKGSADKVLGEPDACRDIDLDGCRDIDLDASVSSPSPPVRVLAGTGNVGTAGCVTTAAAGAGCDAGIRTRC